MRRLVFLFVLLFAAGCATRPAATFDEPEARLVDAMARRLAISGEVAWIKYENTLPVRDPKREAAVLDEVTALAQARGMDVARVRAFFADQIAASCAQQEKLIYLWSRGAPLPSYPPRSLRTGVRRDIDAANVELLDALSSLPRVPRDFRAQADRALRARGVYWQAARLATAPL